LDQKQSGKDKAFSSSWWKHKSWSKHWASTKANQSLTTILLWP